MKRFILSIGLLFITTIVCFAQIDTVGIGYVRFFPPAIQPKLTEIEIISTPYQFAELVEPNMPIISFSEKTISGNYTLLTHIPDAKSLNANLHVEGETSFKLYISDPDETLVYGPYSYNDFTNKILATPLIPGDIMRFRILCEQDEIPNISILRIGYDFVGIAQKDANFGRSGACNIDINCPEGVDWQTMKRSVVRMIVGSRWLCTGSIVNTLRFDKKAYLLTADHCFESGTPESTVTYFNYESPTCYGPDGQINHTISGSVMLAHKDDGDGKIDFALLKLHSQIPEHYNVIYAGWDASGRIPNQTTTIHHPKGDVKKISFDYDAPMNSSYPYSGNYDLRSFWKIADWELGTTEGGSSGSPLYDVDQRVIGVLTGGDARCGNSVNDYYTQLSYAWSTYSDSSQQLKYWLNPDNISTRVCATYSSVELIESRGIDQNLDIYPNPVTSSLSFNWNGVVNTKLTVKMVDQMGRIVLFWDTKMPMDGKIKLEVQDISKGVYFLQVWDSEYSAETVVFIQ